MGVMKAQRQCTNLYRKKKHDRAVKKDWKKTFGLKTIDRLHYVTKTM